MQFPVQLIRSLSLGDGTMTSGGRSKELSAEASLLLHGAGDCGGGHHRGERRGICQDR